MDCVGDDLEVVVLLPNPLPLVELLRLDLVFFLGFFANNVVDVDVDVDVDVVTDVVVS